MSNELVSGKALTFTEPQLFKNNVDMALGRTVWDLKADTSDRYRNRVIGVKSRSLLEMNR